MFKNAPCISGRKIPKVYKTHFAVLCFSSYYLYMREQKCELRGMVVRSVHREKGIDVYVFCGQPIWSEKWLCMARGRLGMYPYRTVEFLGLETS
jgi:hypothetical protein